MSSTHPNPTELSPEALQAVADRLLRQRKAAAAAAPAAASIAEGAPAPLTYAQEALWLVERLGTGARAYNETVTLRLTGQLDIDALERSLAALVQRHAALRARFEAGDDGVAFQTIMPAPPLALERLDRPGIDEASLLQELHELADRPFDLAQPPLYRVTLVRTAPDDYVLLWNVHHIVWDEWSVRLFLLEFGAYYSAFVQGQEAPRLPPAALAYADFAAWQRGHMTQQSLEQQRDHWLRRLADAPALLTLPLDRARPARRTFAGGNHAFTFPPRVALALDALTRSAGATPYMTLLALYQALLARLSGSDDIVVRSPTSGRTHPQVAGLIGLFVNMLPLRGIVHGGDTFAGHLERVRQNTLEALGNQTFPYEWLVAALARRRDLSYEAVAQADFVMREGHAASGDLPGLTVRSLETLHGGAINDLTWIAQPNGEALQCEFVYATDLFDPATVADFAERLERLAASVVDAPERTLDAIDLRLPYDEAKAQRSHPLTAAQDIRRTQLGDIDAGLRGLCVSVACVADETGDGIDAAHLAHAALIVAARHDALRLRFDVVDSTRVLQYVAAAEPVALAHVDVSTTADPDAAALAAIDAFAQTGADAATFGCLLVVLGPERWRVCCRFHPLAVDVGDAVALTREVLTVHASLAAGATPSPLAAESLLRHLHDEAEWRYGPRSAAARDHWRSALADSVAATFAGSGSRARAAAPMRVGVDLPPALTEAIGAYAQATDTRVADLMFALAALYAQRATGTHRLRVGALATLASAGDVVAQSQAFVPVVVDGDAAAGMLANVRAVLDARRQSLDHARDYPAIAAAMLPGGEAAFRVAIDTESRNDAAVVHAADRHDATIRYTLDAAGRCTGLAVTALPGLYESWELESMLAALSAFLGSVCTAAATAPLQHAALMTAHERERLLAQVCAPQSVDVEPVWVHEWFERQAGLTPDAVAVRLDAHDISYAQLNARSDRFAQWLVTQGVGPDSVVGLFLERSIDLLVAVFGTLKAGGAYLPIDTESPDARIAYVLGNARPKLVVTSAAMASRIAQVDAAMTICAIDTADFSNVPAVPIPRARGEHLAYVMYTSGSTGQPKGVETAHAALLNRLAWMQAEYGLDGADRVLQKTPYTFDVSVWELVWPLMTGARLVLAKPGGHRDADYLRELIRSEGITLTHFVPSMLAAFLAQSPVLDCPALRDVMCSGEALPAPLAQRFFAAHATARLHNLYGPTEAAIDVTYHECLRDTDTASVPIGRAIWNTRMYVLDDRLEPVPLGFVGELYIGGVGLARGYRHRPDLTTERFVADPFAGTATARMYRTGDLARWRADGALDYLGRRDQQVKIRGVRIELGEIETLLAQHADVKEAVVRPFERDGDVRLVGYVIARDGASVSPDALRAHLKRQLPDAMVPSAFVSLASWPLTANGKLDQRGLPAPDLGAQSAHEHEPPQGEVEASLARVWSQLLRVERVGRRDNFFDLGGHSLLGIQLIARLRTDLDVQLPFEALFECRDLETLARRIEAIRWSRESAAPDSDDADTRERLVI